MNHLLNDSPKVLQTAMRTMFKQPCLVFLKKKQRSHLIFWSQKSQRQNISLKSSALGFNCFVVVSIFWTKQWIGKAINIIYIIV